MEPSLQLLCDCFHAKIDLDFENEFYRPFLMPLYSIFCQQPSSTSSFSLGQELESHQVSVIGKLEFLLRSFSEHNQASILQYVRNGLNSIPNESKKKANSVLNEIQFVLINSNFDMISISDLLKGI